MAVLVVFHGTPTEGVELLAAIGHNCICEPDPETGLRLGTCPAHAIFHDQRILDGLLVSRQRLRALSREEFGT